MSAGFREQHRGRFDANLEEKCAGNYINWPWRRTERVTPSAFRPPAINGRFRRSPNKDGKNSRRAANQPCHFRFRRHPVMVATWLAGIMFNVFRPYYPAVGDEAEDQIHDLLIDEILGTDGKPRSTK